MRIKRTAKTSAQSDLNFRWVHMSFCWYFHEVAYIRFSLRSACAFAQADQSSLSPWKRFGSLATQSVHYETLVRLRGCEADLSPGRAHMQFCRKRKCCTPHHFMWWSIKSKVQFLYQSNTEHGVWLRSALFATYMYLVITFKPINKL